MLNDKIFNFEFLLFFNIYFSIAINKELLSYIIIKKVQFHILLTNNRKSYYYFYQPNILIYSKKNLRFFLYTK